MMIGSFCDVDVEEDCDVAELVVDSVIFLFSWRLFLIFFCFDFDFDVDDLKNELEMNFDFPNLIFDRFEDIMDLKYIS